MNLPRNIGRRGAYLLSKGSLYVIFGLGLIVRGDAPVPDYYALLQRVAPTVAWGVAWLLAGLVSCAAAFMPKIHNRHLSPIAFAGLMAMATIWSLGILSTYLLPGAVDGHPWIVASLFGSLMASTAVVAGWPEEVQS